MELWTDAGARMRSSRRSEIGGWGAMSTAGSILVVAVLYVLGFAPLAVAAAKPAWRTQGLWAFAVIFVVLLAAHFLWSFALFGQS